MQELARQALADGKVDYFIGWKGELARPRSSPPSSGVRRKLIIWFGTRLLTTT